MVVPSSRGVPTAVLMVALLAAGCARTTSDAPSLEEPAATGATAGSPTPTQTTAAPTTGPTGPTAAETPSVIATDLDDGRHFGWVTAVDEAGTVTIDLAEFLTGEAANQAAQEHGDEVPVPNDYYIVNDNPRPRTLTVAPNARFELLDWNRCCDDTYTVDLETFALAFRAGDQGFTEGEVLLRPTTSPFWFRVRDGAVVRLQEQYLP